MPVQLYASSTSVFPGETLRIHAASDQPTKYLLRIEGITNTEKTEVMLNVRSVTPKFDPANANANDCGWEFDEIAIPANWPSGLYRAFIVADPTFEQPNLMFVVKAGPNQPRANILCSIPFTTWYAYSPWFAKSLYPYNSYHGKCQKVSLNRPLASMNSIFDIHDDEKFVEGAVLAISRVPSAKYWFDIREENFVAWLSAQSEIKVDYCSNIDLHQDPTILDPYQLFLSIGHDEYWSKEMRNTVERFVAHGGNAAFFAANVSWFEITFEDADCRSMVCEKVQLPLTQKVRAGDPVNFTESNWLARPENSLSGVSFRMGAYNPFGTENQTVGFEVLDARHWVFKDTGLANGAVFGADAYIVGYETDAFCPPIGPRNFKTIAEARFSKEQNESWNMIDEATKVGRATMGVFRPIAYDDLSQSNVYTPATPGTVFTAGTTDWALGLKANLSVVTQITTNVLTTLGHKRQKKLPPHTPVYQYLPAVDLTNATDEELSFYYSSSLDGPPEYSWCSDGVAFFALSTLKAGSTPLLQYSRVDGDKWYYRYCVDHLPEGSGWTLMADTGLRVFPNGEIPGTVPIFEYRSEDGLRHLYSPFKDVAWKGMTLQLPLFWAYADVT